VQGELRSGGRITEEAIAARYAVSRTPVREALRRLEQAGLVAHLTYGGYWVPPTDFNTASELYEVRVALEEINVERACRAASHEALDEIIAFWSQREGHIAANLDIVYADEQFHETIALAGGNQTAYTMLRGVNARLHALRVRDFSAHARIEATFQQHSSILSAITRNDARLAMALIRAHILESQAYVVEAARALEEKAP
jgi:DNA-binding GntR family transcriptional regulator